MMIYQYTAAALVSEHKVLRPPGVGRFDPDVRQPGGPRVDGLDLGADTRGRVLEGVERIVAIELVVGAQALDLRTRGHGARRPDGELRAGAGVSEAHARIRARIAHLDRDREPGPDLAAATELVHDGAFADLVGPS